MSVVLISVSQDAVVSNKHEERTRHYYVIFQQAYPHLFHPEFHISAAIQHIPLLITHMGCIPNRNYTIVYDGLQLQTIGIDNLPWSSNMERDRELRLRGHMPVPYAVANTLEPPMPCLRSSVKVM